MDNAVILTPQSRQVCHVTLARPELDDPLPNGICGARNDHCGHIMGPVGWRQRERHHELSGHHLPGAAVDSAGSGQSRRLVTSTGFRKFAGSYGTLGIDTIGNRHIWKGVVMAGPQPRAILLSAPQRAVLERLLRQHSCPQALALRVRIILGAAQGTRNEPLAALLGCSPLTVQKWRRRWADALSLLAAAETDPTLLTTTIAFTLADAPRSGRPPVFSAEQVVEIVNLACTPPRSVGCPVDAWTPRELADQAERQGIVSSISPTSVGRFLGRGRSSASSLSLLAQCQDQGR